MAMFNEFKETKCPVCKVLLGRRTEDSIFRAHCEECKATFYWKPGVKKPSVVMDASLSKKVCGCGGCGR